MLALLDLDLVHAVDEVVVALLLGALLPCPHRLREYAEGGVAFGEPEHVGRQLPDVPVVVHRLPRPVLRSQLPERVDEAAVLGLRQLHPLSMADRRDVLHAHCRVSQFRLPFLFTCSKNMSTTSSTSRIEPRR